MSSRHILLKYFHIALILYALTHMSRELVLSRQNRMRSNIPETFILDFDGTITKSDTIAAIFKAVLAVQDERGKDMSRTWQELVVRYSRDYQAHVRDYKPREEERHSAQQEVEFYRSLRAVEEKSFSRISDSDIFSDIDEQEWEKLGRQALESGDVVVREGFEDFLAPIKEGAKWSIVSVNFSRAFIRGVLGSDVGPGSNISILANQPNTNGFLKGPWGPVMATSGDKFNATQSLIGSSDDGTGGRIVYIGDSGTDIECLLADDIIGIIMSDDGQSSLLKTMGRIGQETLHIEEYEKRTGAVYWARNYLEIVQSPLMGQDSSVIKNH